MKKTIKLKKTQNKIEYIIEDYDENKGKRYTTYKAKIQEDDAKQFIFGYFLHIKFFQKIYNFYSFPAERSGAVLFYKTIIGRKKWCFKRIRIGKQWKYRKIQEYSEPVNDYVKFLNSISDRSKGVTEVRYL